MEVAMELVGLTFLYGITFSSDELGPQFFFKQFATEFWKQWTKELRLLSDFVRWKSTQTPYTITKITKILLIASDSYDFLDGFKKFVDLNY